MEEENKDKGFVIKDRRIFDEKGDVREDKGKEEKTERNRPEETDLLAPTFSNFILSLSTTAMYHFGDFPDPMTGERKVNLKGARHTIDILAMLKEKTEGNLDESEKSLLEGLLFELRMRYVKEASGQK
ncbi:MAG: DUF1844 domain-containing protein [Syntrophales bacterium]|nr:DUF1844 domain-containing protein [Syntrophales bacterium]